jgi:hypothetical protein
MGSSARETAKAIVASMKNHYGAPHTVVPADESQFDHLDLNGYRTFQAALESEGFLALGNVEILEVSQSPTTLIARTMIRCMISGDGTTYAGYYQVRPRIWRRLKLLVRGLINLRLIAAPLNFITGMLTRHCLEFETELNDGRFLITSNAEAAARITGPRSIESNIRPYSTPTAALLQAHQRRLGELVAETNAKPLILRTYADVEGMQKRQNAQKIAHRATVQWVTYAELERMSGGNVEQAEEVFEEVRKLLADERPAA